MANKTLFKSNAGKFVPPTDAVNNENAPAYALTPQHALAQYAATGCLNATFYATAAEQLTTVLDLCERVEAEFIAKTAVFCRERGFMKDVPALLCAVLSRKDKALFEKTFPRVIDNGKMLRNFVQIMRSGATGRKSLGSLPKRMVREWFESRNEEAIFKASVGNAPSFADILKMVHPKPKTPRREALYGYLIGREHDAEALPEIVRRFEKFKAGDRTEMPDVPFQMLTALELGTPEWTAIARNASWQTTRMNLNTFARHGVFEQLRLNKERSSGFNKLRNFLFGQPKTEMAKVVASRLRDSRLIAKARVFPYQLMTAYMMTDESVPAVVRDALQDAMEIAIANVPEIGGKVYVCADVSGSMSSPVTGYRQGSTSKIRCIDVAALVAASILRKNPNAAVIPFEQDVISLRLNERDSVMTNAGKLASIGGGGTNCSAPLALLNRHQAAGDLVVFVSDSESWLDAGRGRGTATMIEWNRFKQRNPQARMVCIDIQPYGTTQAQERDDVLNIGGFSDQVFEVIAEFARGEINANHWVGIIESTAL